MKIEDKEIRIKVTLQSASDNFWATVAKNFPEAKSGDFPPDMDYKLSQIMEQSIRVWLDCNTSRNKNL